MAGNTYAGDERVDLRLGHRVVALDSAASSVTTAAGDRFGYDALVLATGSYAFVPPIPGHDLPLCHVYRTLDDLDAIKTYAQRAVAAHSMTRRCRHRRRVARAGGGHALRGFGMTPHVVEMAPRLMAQQLDEAGGALLARMIGDLGSPCTSEWVPSASSQSARERASRSATGPSSTPA